MGLFKHKWAPPLLTGSALALMPGTVYAYIDPGTGSYVFQMLIAGLVTAGFLVRQYWKRIADFMKHKQPTGNGDNGDS